MEGITTKIHRPMLICLIITISILSIGMTGTRSFKKEIILETTPRNIKYTGIIEEEEPQNLQSYLSEDWEVAEVGKYIDINDEEQVDKVMYITESTPLDEVTASIIVDYGHRLEVPLSLILSLIDIESKFDQYALGAAKDRGYCQIIPSAEKWLTKNYGEKIGIEYDPSRIYEPEYNIGLGVLYLHLLGKAYDNDFHRVLSEYNRGPYNLEKYFNTHKTYQTSYSRLVLNNQEKYIDMQT